MFGQPRPSRKRRGSCVPSSSSSPTHVVSLSSLLWLCLLTGQAITPTQASVWPFPLNTSRRPKAEGMVNIGTLGLGDGTWQVDKLMAFGDWNGDQSLDVITTNSDRTVVQIHLWDHKTYKYKQGYNLTFPDTSTTTSPIESIVPIDFNQDGKLDLVVFTRVTEDTGGGWWGSKEEKLKGMIYLGGGEGGAPLMEGIPIDGLSSQQPLVLDAFGSLRPDLLAMDDGQGGKGAKSQLKLWKNQGPGFEITQPPFVPSSKICEPATPASNAFLDLDGDCLSDIFLMCKSKYSNDRSFQIWKNREQAGFVFAGEWALPSGAGAISFADMDRDGTMDLVFPTCSSTSQSTGVGRDCFLNIAYNKQKPLCAKSPGSFLGGIQSVINSVNKTCRSPNALCEADDDFSFDLNPDGDSFTSVPIDQLYPGTTSILFSEPSSSTSGSSEFTPHIPLKIGDYNVDGFPDVLVMVVNGTAQPPQGGIFGNGRSAGVQVKLLQNVACDKESQECQGGRWQAKRRRLQASQGDAMKVLDDIWDVRNSAWLDIDEDGTLDLVLQRSGKQDGQTFTFIQNNLFSDAFFLKTAMLNGACQAGICEPLDGSAKYKAFGASLPGATYKFTVLDTAGRRAATQVSQLTQTAYNALQLPYSFFGLGRTNNYVENLFVGSTLQTDGRFTNLEGVIPNSHVVFNPPQPSVIYEPVDPNEPDSPLPGPQPLVKNPSVEWHKSLYLKPGDWVPWVIATLLGVMLVLASIIYGLHMREKGEDEMERRKAMHRINFQAL